MYTFLSSGKLLKNSAISFICGVTFNLMDIDVVMCDFVMWHSDRFEASTGRDILVDDTPTDCGSIKKSIINVNLTLTV